MVELQIGQIWVDNDDYVHRKIIKIERNVVYYTFGSKNTGFQWNNSEDIDGFLQYKQHLILQPQNNTFIHELWN